MALLPFGQLHAFGTLIFSGPGALTPVKTAWPTEFSGEYDTSLLPVGRKFPYDAQGITAAPYKGIPTITYELIILADYGLDDAHSFQQVRQRWNTVYTALSGTYTWGSIANTSGQKGTLVVYDEVDTTITYSATARILKPSPWQLTKGQPSELTVQLPFALLSDFS